MKIVSVETFCDAEGRYCLSRLRAEDGAEGWGQVAPYFADVSAEVLHRQLAWFVLDQSVETIDDIARLGDRMFHYMYKFSGSHLWRAWAGIDLALWDLLGRRTGQPVATLIDPDAQHGGLRPLRAYASSMRRDITAQDEARRLAELRDRHGYTAFKVRVGKPNGNNEDAAPGRTEAIITHCHRVLDDDAALMVDANGGYTPDRAIEVGRMLEDHGYAHFEEPCPFWEIEQTREVAEALTIDVAGGEQDHDLAQFWRICETRSVDVIQPDVCYAGGLTRSLRVAAMAADASIPVLPHSANRSLLLPVSVHLLCAIPNPGPYVEVGIDDQAWFAGAYHPSPEVRDGAMIPPAGPGWGVTIKPDWLTRATRRETTAK